MKSNLYKYIALIIGMMGVFFSCEKDSPVAPDNEVVNPKEEETKVIHYRATVSGGEGTRATIDDDKHYIFEAGDRLFVTSGTDMYGALTLVSGVGTSKAVFEGELTCVDNFEPENSTVLSGTLVSISDAIHTYSDGKITETTYPLGYCDTFTDAVSKYSNFIGSSTFGDKSFVLAQKSSFMIFSIIFDEDVSAGTSTTVAITNGDDTVVRTSSMETESVNGDVQLNFVAAFPQGFEFVESSSKPRLTVTASGIDDTYYFPAMALQSNQYYTFYRYLVESDYFTIEALEASTSVTFNYATSASDGIQYSKDGGRNWTSYNMTKDGAITLESAGDKLSFRGKRTAYNCSGGTRLITVADNKPCYIYGNMMSLLCSGDTYTMPTELTTENTFHSAFKDCTWVRAKSDEKLLLPASIVKKCSYEQMFSGCTGLTTTPVAALPAETLYEGTYYQMFYGCTSMISAPSIAAVTTGRNSCHEMFYGCTSLTASPALLATTVGNGSYRRMFYGCTSLVTASTIGTASTLFDDQSCYMMFEGCTSLQTMPSLPATTLASSCYNRMFQDCTSLVNVVSLPATELASACYRDMFYRCTALVTASILPTITAVASFSCRGMFSGCTSLQTVGGTINLAGVSAQESFTEMFNGCTNLTTAPELHINARGSGSCYNMFINCKSLTSVTGTITSDSTDPNTLRGMFNGCTALESAPTFNITAVGNECCKQMFKDCISLTSFQSTGDITADSTCYAFYEEMFAGCKTLVSVPDLDLKKLGDYACKSMFSGCSVLETVNGSIKLTESSRYQTFYQMFFNCSDLTSAPTLSFDASGSQSCYRMFRNCGKLTSVGGNGITSSSADSYIFQEMFYGCSSLASVPELNITGIGVGGCSNMFNKCKALTSVTGSITINSTEGYTLCEMFSECEKLETIPTITISAVGEKSCYKMLWKAKKFNDVSKISLSASTLAANCYESMFDSCTSLTTAPALPATTLASGCYKIMFWGCTSLTTAPDLPATELVNECYQLMFQACSSLTYIKCLATSTSGSNCTANWLAGNNGVNVPNTSDCIFVKNAAAAVDFWSRDVNGIPSEWTVQYNP